MQCPKCGSKQVREMSFVTNVTQVICESCNKMGTYYEFGMQNDINIGLATKYDGAVYTIEQAMFDQSDPTFSLGITIHQIGNQSACNFWARYYDQWLKVIPERVLDWPPSPQMLAGEVLRFMKSNKGVKMVENFRWNMAIRSLHQDAINLCKQN